MGSGIPFFRAGLLALGEPPSLWVGLRRRGSGLPYLRSQPGFLARGLSRRALCHGASAPPRTPGVAGGSLPGRPERAEVLGRAGAKPRRRLPRALRDLGAVLDAHQPQVPSRAAGEFGVAQLQQQLPPLGGLHPPDWAAAGPEAQRAQLGLLPAAGRQGLELRGALLPHLRRSDAVGRGQDRRLQ